MHYILIYLLNISVFGIEKDIDHAIYISVANVDFNKVDNKVMISLKVFSDDLEDAIHNDTGRREKLVGREDFTDVQKVINEYIAKKIDIDLDGKKVNLQVKSCENIGDTTWIYLFGEIGSFNESISIRNQVLFEVFDAQKNIVQIEYAGQKYYHSLTKDKPSVTITL